MSEITHGQKLDAAMVAHEANRAFCLTIGDSSQVDWRTSAEWQRESAVHGVEAIVNDPSITAEQQHQAWCDEKIAKGWTHGAVKDAAEKTHPCLVPYDQLPAEQQVKDALFGAVVRVVLGIPLFPFDAHTARHADHTLSGLREQIAKLEEENAMLAEHCALQAHELQSLVDTVKDEAAATAPTDSEGPE
jgi:hypothetical protein